jgi:hypothetical protein
MASILCAALGLFFLLLAGLACRRTRRFLARVRSARGTVVGLEHRTGIDPGDTWHPVVAFRDAAGARRVFTERTGSNPAAYAEGDRVTVLYDPAESADACVRSFGSLWLLPAVLAVFAAVWTAVAIAAYLVAVAP